MPQTDPWTVGRLLSWTTDYLKRHAAESPRLDAEVLLAESLHCRRIDLYARYEEVPDEGTRSAFREFVRRRAEGMPVAYLVGRREFYSLDFAVTPAVLIPRPETEYLVVAAIDAARAVGRDRPLEICDVGTGSGIIAVCLAKHLPASRLTAVDISRQALEVARSNARAHGVDNRIEFLPSDLLSALPEDRRFDLIVSNPPYVSRREIDSLQTEVKDHEPRVALVGGERGTEVIEALLPQAAARLPSGGQFLIEIGPAVEDRVRALIEADQRFEADATIKDLAGLARVVPARRK